MKQIKVTTEWQYDETKAMSFEDALAKHMEERDFDDEYYAKCDIPFSIKLIGEDLLVRVAGSIEDGYDNLTFVVLKENGEFYELSYYDIEEELITLWY